MIKKKRGGRGGGGGGGGPCIESSRGERDEGRGVERGCCESSVHREPAQRMVGSSKTYDKHLQQRARCQGLLSEVWCRTKKRQTKNNPLMMML